MQVDVAIAALKYHIFKPRNVLIPFTNLLSITVSVPFKYSVPHDDVCKESKLQIGNSEHRNFERFNTCTISNIFLNRVGLLYSIFAVTKLYKIFCRVIETHGPDLQQKFSLLVCNVS